MRDITTKSIEPRNLTVVVAEQHPEMRMVLSSFVSQHFGAVITVANGQDLISAAFESRADVIVSDIDISVGDELDAMLPLRALGFDIPDVPLIDGLKIISAVRTLGLETPFVLLGTDMKGTEQYLQQGAAAYVHKYDIHGDLIEAVLRAASGGSFVSRSAAKGGNSSGRKAG